MKIKTKLTFSTAVVLMGVLTIAAISLIALNNIESTVHQLTGKSVPLHVKTMALNYEIENLTAKFSGLGKVSDVEQLSEMNKNIEQNFRIIEQLERDIRNLGTNNTGVNIDSFKIAHKKIQAAVAQRLDYITMYKNEATTIQTIVNNIEKSLLAVKSDIDRLSVQAENASAEAQKRSFQSNDLIKRLYAMRSYIKDMSNVVSEINSAKNRYRLSPLKERMVAALGGAKNIPELPDDPDNVKQLRSSLNNIAEMVLDEKNGLVALRANAFTDPASEQDFVRIRGNTNKLLESVSSKALEIIDPIEIQLVKDRQMLDVSKKFVEAAKKIEAAGHAIENDIHELKTNVALVMLSETSQELDQKIAIIKDIDKKFYEDLSGLTHNLTNARQLKFSSSARNALSLFNLMKQSIDNISDTKKSVITSESALQEIMAKVTEEEKELTSISEKRVKLINALQQNAATMAQESVWRSFVLIVSGSLALLIGCIVANVIINRSITRPLLRLSNTMEKIGVSKDLSARVTEYDKDNRNELAALTNSFNTMLDQLEQREAQIKIAKLEVAEGNLATAEARRENEVQQNLINKLKEAQENLKAVQAELVTTARQAGMAEIATNVLHNVGNVLNSVNISVGLISNLVRTSKATGLGKAVQLISEHTNDLGDFLTKDQKGKMLPEYLAKLAETLNVEQKAIGEELIQLTKSVDHIKEIVATQQSYAGSSRVLERVQISELIEDAINMNADSLSNHQVSVIKEFAKLPAMLLDRHKVLQIMINLISNAKNAMRGVNDREYQITIRLVQSNENTIRIQVADNGEGIPPENLSRIFAHGFTTREDGHGFGLHSCVLAAREMGGSLTAHSDGVNQGAVFTLDLPIKAEGKTEAATDAGTESATDVTIAEEIL